MNANERELIKLISAMSARETFAKKKKSNSNSNRGKKSKGFVKGKHLKHKLATNKPSSAIKKKRTMKYDPSLLPFPMKDMKKHTKRRTTTTNLARVLKNSRI